MQITLKRVDKKCEDYQRIKQLYKTAFPAEERAPFWLLSIRSKKPAVDFWGIYDGPHWVGLMYVVSYAKLSYLFYFAVSSQMRGQGYGSGALEALKKQYSDHRIFLAIEQVDEKADNYAERVKRKAFYQRNGFTELHQKLQEGTVVYELLGIGGAVKAEEYDRLIEQFTGKLLKKCVVMRIVEA